MAEAGLEERKPLWAPSGRPPRSHAQGQGKGSGPSNSKAGPGVPSVANREPLPATPPRTGTQVQLGREAAGQLRVRLVRGAATLRGQADCGLLGARLWGPRARASGEGLAEHQLDAKCFSQTWQRSEGRRLPAPGQSRVRPPLGLHEPGHVAGPPWASVSRHRTRQSHEQGFLGHETQLCRETDTLLTLLRSGSRQQGPRGHGRLCMRAARQRGTRLIAEARCSQGLTQGCQTLGSQRQDHPQTCRM